MDKKLIQTAKQEAERFLQRVAELEAVEAIEKARHEKQKGTWHQKWFPVESGALRRSSLDLTRALAKMRRP